MLTLVTSNPAKYQPFSQLLERLRIGLTAPKVDVPELQSATFAEALEHKARAMAEIFGHPVLVDDAGLVLDAYRPFPGPLTSVVLRGLGQAGLQRLLRDASDRATMECHLGWWNGHLRSWSGAVHGRLDPSRTPSDARMLLSDLFVPDVDLPSQALAHRAQALAHLEQEVLGLHLETSSAAVIEECHSSEVGAHQCPFCIEIEGTGESIFSEIMGGRLASRILYQDDDFIVLPPLGEFIEGGLLLLTREHIPSFAHLERGKLARLAQLMRVIRRELARQYGISPLIFEHGPAPQRGKGVCCVDHAHFNIFPAKVLVGPQLAERMSMPIRGLDDVLPLRSAEFGYLFVQENDGSMRAYDGQLVPTQLVRRIIATQIGLPGRWHWKDYPGCDELVATYHALKGKLQL
jgi:inosine/xanthosine triphosphate pyrophosphatase family protein/diadenosine tetraphosphate (Ap4A) HIT family hydrolase